jgi:hypothetical protein
VYVNVRSVGVGRVGVCMLCTCVSEEGGGEKSAVSEPLSLLSYTLRYVSLADLGRLCQFGFR